MACPPVLAFSVAFLGKGAAWRNSDWEVRGSCQEKGEGRGRREKSFHKIMSYSISHPHPSPIITKYFNFK